MPDYRSLRKLAEEAQEKNISIGELVLEEQAQTLGMKPEEILAAMDQDLDVMEAACSNGMKRGLKSYSGLTGGEGFLMIEQAMREDSLSGSYCGEAMACAMAVAGYNAAMGKIVAAPTAGSCGVLPGVLLPLLRTFRIDRDQAAKAMICAGGIGIVLATKASIAGAEGGCQAECGSAAAMAAGALVELMGGTPFMAVQAAAMAIKNQLGLVCDPVAGLVEVPCIKRNAGSVMVAIGAAEMALAGITSVIPPDEVVSAMRSVGEAMSSTLRETAEGGLAATVTGNALKARLVTEPLAMEMEEE